VSLRTYVVRARLNAAESNPFAVARAGVKLGLRSLGTGPARKSKRHEKAALSTKSVPVFERAQSTAQVPVDSATFTPAWNQAQELGSCPSRKALVPARFKEVSCSLDKASERNVPRAVARRGKVGPGCELCSSSCRSLLGSSKRRTGVRSIYSPEGAIR
jgi:hypothetical protein